MYSILTSVLVGMFVVSFASHAQNPSAFFEEVNNSGREFFLTFPPCIEETETSDSNTCVLFIFGDKDQEVTVEVASKGYSETRFLKAFEVEKWELSPDIAQVYRHFGDTDIVADSLFAGAAVHVLAEHRVVVNVETRFGKRRARTIAKPADLAHCSYYRSLQYVSIGSSRDSAGDRFLPSSLSILGIVDSTELEISFWYTRVKTESGDSLVYEGRRIVLNKGDILHLSSLSQVQEIRSCDIYGGPHINGKTPFAVAFSGSYGVSPHDSTDFDFAFTYLESWGNLFNKSYASNSAFDSDYIEMQFLSDDTIAGLENYIIGGNEQYVYYSCNVKVWNDLAIPPWDSRLYTFAESLTSYRFEPRFSYSHNYDFFDHGTASMFLITEQDTDTTTVHFHNHFRSGPKNSLFILKYSEEVGNWTPFQTTTPEEYSAPTNESYFWSTSASCSPGLYYAYGTGHSCYSEDGHSLVQTESGTGCQYERYDNNYQQTGSVVQGTAYYGCNDISRIYLRQNSKNCTLKVVEHDYLKSTISYELHQLDTSSISEAWLVALSLSGRIRETYIKWDSAPTHIEQSSQHISISISPHPAEDGSVLAIESEQSQQAKVSIFDSQGTLHTRIEQQLGGSTSLPLPDNLASGLWLVVVETATGRYETTFVKH